MENVSDKITEDTARQKWMKLMKKKEKKRKKSTDGFEEWGGYMNAKITKLEQQFNLEEQNQDEIVSNIFKGVAIFVNGYTEPSADELRFLMLQHGGIYHHYYRTGKTTHIIASSLPNSKFNQMKTLKVVKCEWITESIKAGRLLDYKKFLLLNNFPGALNFKTPSVATKFANDEPVKKKEPDVPKTAADDGYIADFYSNSRLHYISELGSSLKQYVQEMRENHNGIFPGRARLEESRDAMFDPIAEEDTISDGSVIMHIDMDCFFVSVALRNYPHLKGKPVAVTHSRGKPPPRNDDANRKFEMVHYKKKMESKIKSKMEYLSESDDDEELEEWSAEASSMSEIASCSYEARRAGVRKGMYLGVALKLCPDLKTVPYDFVGYKEVSLTLYNTVSEYTLDVEALSCDELFIDCSNLIAELKIHPLKFAEVLRKEIESKTKCTSSVGIASNKLQAKLATKHAKPNGQFYLTPDKVEDFMLDLNVDDLPGVGRTISAKLRTLNIKTCRELQRLQLVNLRKIFGGKTGETLYKNCRGIDDRKVKSSHERKSVSAEVNYGIRFNDDGEAEKFLKELSMEVAKRLAVVKMSGKAITLKLMFRAKDAPKETAKFLGHGVCDQINRTAAVNVPTNDGVAIGKYVIGLYHQLAIPANELRGVGIQVTKLECLKKNVNTLQAYFGGEQKPKQKQNEVKLPSPEPVIEPLPQPPPPQPPPARIPTASQIDMEVLNSLPEDIRSEVMREYGLVTPSINTKPEKAPVPPAQAAPVSDKGTEKLFRLSLKEMRIMIREWVAAEHHPQSWDVSMLKSYLSNLVEKRELENLSVLLKCLHRHIRTQKLDSVVWKVTYNEIVDVVQSSMVHIYGKRLETQRFL